MSKVRGCKSKLPRFIIKVNCMVTKVIIKVGNKVSDLSCVQTNRNRKQRKQTNVQTVVVSVLFMAKTYLLDHSIWVHKQSCGYWKVMYLWSLNVFSFSVSLKIITLDYALICLFTDVGCTDLVLFDDSQHRAGGPRDARMCGETITANWLQLLYGAWQFTGHLWNVSALSFRTKKLSFVFYLLG